MKEHFINDSGYYPYGDYDYAKVSKEYIEQENYDKSFFEVLDYLKDNKEKVKEFLKDLVFVEMIDDNNLLHKDNYFISKELFEKEYNKIFNNNSDILTYKINTLTLDEQKFEKIYSDIQKGDFSKLEIYDREIDYTKDYSSNYNENSIFRIEKNIVLNEEEIENTKSINEALQAINDGIHYMKYYNRERKVEVELDLSENKYELTEFIVNDNGDFRKEFNLKENALSVFLNNSLHYLSLNEVNFEKDLNINGFSKFNENDYSEISTNEYKEKLRELKTKDFYDIEYNWIREIEEKPINNNLKITFDNKEDKFNLNFINKENKEKNIEISIETASNLIGTEKFADIYFEINNSNFEKLKEKKNDMEY